MLTVVRRQLPSGRHLNTSVRSCLLLRRQRWQASNRASVVPDSIQLGANALGTVFKLSLIWFCARLRLPDESNDPGALREYAHQSCKYHGIDPDDRCVL